ncbi:MAG: putative transporter [Actinomycetia bacterium]|nr:putative transporter [Actinomycetes bacterium]
MSILRDLPRFRYLWLSKAISSAGSGASRVALVLLVIPSGSAAVTCTLLATMAGVLVSPVAGAIADRADQRLLLLIGETGQGVIYAVMAIARPPLPVLLPLVALASLLATLASPAGKSSVGRLVPAERRSQANALLSLAFNLQIIAGPAAGGVLAGIAGAPAAFAVNAASFWISALLLTRLGPLPPLQDDTTAATAAGAPSQRQPGLLADTVAGLRYAAQAPLVRGLAAGTFLFVTFAAMDNVALVFLVKRSLHGDGIEYGMLSATFGAGMVAASVALARWARRRPGAFWLIGGVISGAAGAVATGLAPTAVLAGAAQAVAGAGNSADLVGTDTLLQQRVPAVMLGRAFSLVYGADQLASVVSYGLAGPLVALAGPRAAFLVAGAGALAGLGVLVPGLRAPDTAAAAPEPVSP